LTSSFPGLVVGLAAVVVLQERRRLTSATRVEPRRADRLTTAEWDAVLPPARSALRARWENSGEISEDDDWLAGLAIFFGATLIALGAVFTKSWLPSFVFYLIVGAALAMIGYGLLAWVQGRSLPPGGRGVLLRSLIVVILAVVVIRWSQTTTYRGTSIDDIRKLVQPADLTRKPGLLTDTYHSSGWGLAASVLVAKALAVALAARVLLDLVAMSAARRLADGSQRTFPAWLAQFYPRRPVRRAVTVAIVGALALILGTGTGLRWWDDVQGERPSLPLPGSTPTTTTTVAVAVVETTAAPVDPGVVETTAAP
jgi:hypothetical protein